MLELFLKIINYKRDIKEEFRINFITHEGGVSPFSSHKIIAK